MSSRFFDTSVVLPAFLRRHPNHQKALDLLQSLGDERPHATITVLGELYTGLTRAQEKGGRPLMGHRQALAAVLAFANGFQVHEITIADWTECVRVKQAAYVEWAVWDCLLWASAKASHCDELLTEDLPGGFTVLEGVRFVNPFD